MENLTDDDLEKSSYELDNEANKNSNDETESHDDKDNDESKE